MKPTPTRLRRLIEAQEGVLVGLQRLGDASPSPEWAHAEEAVLQALVELRAWYAALTNEGQER